MWSAAREEPVRTTRFLHRGRLCEQTGAQDFFVAPRSREAADYLAGRIVH